MIRYRLFSLIALALVAAHPGQAQSPPPPPPPVPLPSSPAPIRMTYSRQADGSVRQHGEQSADHGLTWATSFDFIHRPRKAGEKRP